MVTSHLGLNKFHHYFLLFGALKMHFDELLLLAMENEIIKKRIPEAAAEGTKDDSQLASTWSNIHTESHTGTRADPGRKRHYYFVNIATERVLQIVR